MYCSSFCENGTNYLSCLPISVSNYLNFVMGQRQNGNKMFPFLLSRPYRLLFTPTIPPHSLYIFFIYIYCHRKRYIKLCLCNKSNFQFFQKCSLVHPHLTTCGTGLLCGASYLTSCCADQSCVRRIRSTPHCMRVRLSDTICR